MNRKKKLLILILLSLSVYFVYKLIDKKSLIYTTLGDSFSNGENSYGGYTYGYEDYLKDYLKKNNNVELIDLYTSKNENISTLYNKILKNNSKIIGNNNYNIKKVISESSIITISIGLNDIIYEYYIDKNVSKSQYKEYKVVEYIYNNFKKLMAEILKYKNKNIFIVGYPEKKVEYNKILKKLNNKYKCYSKKNNITFIDTTNILDKNEYFDNQNTIFPNTKGYELIAKKIYNIYKNQEKSWNN